MQFKSFLNEMFSDRKRWDEYQNEVPMLKAGIEVITKIESLGYQSYIVGGAVRDIYMGKTPKDIDICGSATIEEIEKIFPKTTAIGTSRDFGIIVVHYQGFEFEYAMFRGESYEVPKFVRKIL